MRIVVPKESAPASGGSRSSRNRARSWCRPATRSRSRAGAGDGGRLSRCRLSGRRRRGRGRAGRAARLRRSRAQGQRPAPTVAPPTRAAWMRPGAIYRRLADAAAQSRRRSGRSPRGKITAFATDAIPRTTRAQSMDTLSSMANIAGYKGVLLAAVELQPYFPMLMTAAGMVCRRRCSSSAPASPDCRRSPRPVASAPTSSPPTSGPEVKEQIESVGAKYVGIELKESAAAGGGYAKELSRGGPPPPARAARRRNAPSRTSSSRRRSSAACSRRGSSPPTRSAR